METNIISKGADWAEILEACYGTAPSIAAWANRVIEGFRGFLVRGHEPSLVSFQHDLDLKKIRPFVMARVPPEAKALAPMVTKMPRNEFLRWYYPPWMVTTQATLLRGADPAFARQLLATRQVYGACDMLGLVLAPVPGLAAVIYVPHAGVIALSRRHRSLLELVAIHVESGMRIQLGQEVIRAIVSPEGGLVHATNGAPDREALRAAVRRIERSRLRKNRTDPEILGFWNRIARGEMSFVERADGAKRYYLLVENAADRRKLLCLTKTEAGVVAEAARGLANKTIAYSLGVSDSAVSQHLANAAKKLGFATRVELIRIAALLMRDPLAAADDVALTHAEREVVALLARGLTNREIALARRRSVRTIANQVAGLLSKTRTTSRAALAARHSVATR